MRQGDFSRSVRKRGFALSDHDLVHNTKDRRCGTGIIKRNAIDGKAHIRNRSAFFIIFHGVAIRHRQGHDHGVCACTVTFDPLCSLKGQQTPCRCGVRAATATESRGAAIVVFLSRVKDDRCIISVRRVQLDVYDQAGRSGSACITFVIIQPGERQKRSLKVSVPCDHSAGADLVFVGLRHKSVAVLVVAHSMALQAEHSNGSTVAARIIIVIPVAVSAPLAGPPICPRVIYICFILED